MTHVTQLVAAIVVMAVVTSSQNVKPVIKIDLPYSKKTGHVFMSEEASEGSWLGVVRVEDDQPVTCSIEDTYIGLNKLHDYLYQMSLKRHLDREMTAEINVRISCTDAGSPPLTTTGEFTLVVQDVNDNPPGLPDGGYTVELYENQPIGTFVLTVQASDPDEGESGEVRYSLAPEVDNVLFSIDDVTGQIYTAADMDREEDQSLTFTVIATDLGKPALTSSTKVTVTVMDENDNAPILLTTEVRVKENNGPQMSVVGTLRAADLDTGSNGDVIFSKVEDAEDGSSMHPFMVQPNGKVVAVINLDREVTDKYTMDVMVSDKGDPPRSTIAAIHILVDDVNDNAPEVTSPCLGVAEDVGGVQRRGASAKRRDNRLARERYDADDRNVTATTANVFRPPGYVIVDWYKPEVSKIVHGVRATDADLGVNAELVYAVHAINGEDTWEGDMNEPLFAVDEVSGDVFLRRHFRRSDDVMQLLNVSVTDGGAPALVTFCAINVTFDFDLSLLPEKDVLTHAPWSDWSSERQERSGRNGAALVGYASSLVVSCVVFICNLRLL